MHVGAGVHAETRFLLPLSQDADLRRVLCSYSPIHGRVLMARMGAMKSLRNEPHSLRVSHAYMTMRNVHDRPCVSPADALAHIADLLVRVSYGAI